MDIHQQLNRINIIIKNKYINYYKRWHNYTCVDNCIIDGIYDEFGFCIPDTIKTFYQCSADVLYDNYDAFIQVDLCIFSDLTFISLANALEYYKDCPDLYKIGNNVVAMPLLYNGCGDYIFYYCKQSQSVDSALYYKDLYESENQLCFNSIGKFLYYYEISLKNNIYNPESDDMYLMDKQARIALSIDPCLTFWRNYIIDTTTPIN